MGLCFYSLKIHPAVKHSESAMLLLIKEISIKLLEMRKAPAESEDL